MSEEKMRKPRKNASVKGTKPSSLDDAQIPVGSQSLKQNLVSLEDNTFVTESDNTSIPQKKNTRSSRKSSSNTETTKKQKRARGAKIASLEEGVKDEIAIEKGVQEKAVQEESVKEKSAHSKSADLQKSPTLHDITIKKPAKRGPKKAKSIRDAEADSVSNDTLQLKETSLVQEELADTLEPRRGRPKRVQKNVQENNALQEESIITTPELKQAEFKQAEFKQAEFKQAEFKQAAFKESLVDSTENIQEKRPLREVTSQRRKPGRPPKKPSTNPILSLIKTSSSKDISLAITQTSRLPISEEKRLALGEIQKIALDANQKIALDANQKMVLDASQNLALSEYQRDADTHPLLMTQNSADAYTTQERNKGKLVSDIREPSSDDVIVSQDLATTNAKARNQKKSRVSKKSRQQRKSADFIAGEYGTSQNMANQEQYAGQAALGVMGIIDEAPLVDALLPFVLDTQDIADAKNTASHAPCPDQELSILESTQDQDADVQEVTGKASSKKSRRSRRGRKAEARLQKQEQDAQLTQNTDVYMEVDSAPIAEGDELSLLEAEESVKKAGKSAKAKAQKEQVNRVLYVSCVPDEQVEVVITENGVVSEYFIEMEHQAKIRGNIYKGIINNVDTNLQAAFVNFGGGKNGFLQIDEVHPEYWLTPQHAEDGKVEGGGKYPPIQKVLKVGQEVLVQVVKEPAGSKGAFLTTWISLAGRFIVLTPGQEQIGVSRKVEDNAERTRLRELLTGIKPGENMGVIIRTASEGASKANIQNDLKFLKRVWKDVQKKVQSASAPSLIHEEADLPSRAVRDYLTSDISEVWVDSEEVRDSLQDLISVVFPRNKNILKLHKDTRSTLWERFNILRQLDEVTKREVVLPSGGRLVFDQTEALMAIDINSGKTHGKINFEAMVFRTNMEAVDAIARHLRLRDIGGQVVIDFIEMRDRGHCRDIEKAMRTAMKRDRARHDVGRLSSFGLLELVRQRTGTSAISISSEPCPHCRGTGFRRNLEWQAQGVLRDIKSKLASGKNMPSTYVHHVEHEVAFYLLNKKRDRLSELEEKFALKIEIHVK